MYINKAVNDNHTFTMTIGSTQDTTALQWNLAVWGALTILILVESPYHPQQNNNAVVLTVLVQCQLDHS